MSMKNDAAHEREKLNSAVKMFWNPNREDLIRSWSCLFRPPSAAKYQGGFPQSNQAFTTLLLSSRWRAEFPSLDFITAGMSGIA